MIDPTTKKSIILVCANARTPRTFFYDCCKEGPGSWVFLGSDLTLEKTVSEVFEDKYNRIKIGEDLQNVAKNLRSQMVDYVGALSEQRRDNCWWLTTLSEKSPSSSHLFLHLCYLKIGMELSRDTQGSLFIVCDSRSFAKSLYTNLSGSPGYIITYKDFWYDSAHRLIKNTLTLLSQKAWFLARYSGRLVTARLFSLIRKRSNAREHSGSCTIIHSWADARSISGTNTYRDIYFGNLGERLTERGITVYYLLDVIPTVWFPRLVAAAWKNHIDFFVMEDFVSFADLLRSIWRVWDLPSQINDIPLFGELDVSTIVREELCNERYTSMGEHAFLCYQVCKKMGGKFDIGAFIFTYENQACQKMFSLSGKRYASMITTIGYVHTYAIPMYTLYSISAEEKNLVPLPDKIIVNGEKSRDVLVACGFPEDRVFTGGALRYTYLGSEIPAKPEKKDSFNVLVATSVNINEAVELVEKSLKAFSGTSKFNLTVKTHPTLPVRKISKYFRGLSGKAVVSETPIRELLEIADLVLYTSSTVAIEAVARGVPVIHVKSDHSIDMNFFDGESAIPSVSDPEDILQVGIQILYQKKHLSRIESERLVKMYFLPVDDSVISLFASSKLHPSTPDIVDII